MHMSGEFWAMNLLSAHSPDVSSSMTPRGSIPFPFFFLLIIALILIHFLVKSNVVDDLLETWANTSESVGIGVGLWRWRLFGG